MKNHLTLSQKSLRALLVGTIAILSIGSKLNAYTEGEFDAAVQVLKSRVAFLVSHCDDEVYNQNEVDGLQDRYLYEMRRVFAPGSCLQYSDKTKIKALETLFQAKHWDDNDFGDRTPAEKASIKGANQSRHVWIKPTL